MRKIGAIFGIAALAAVVLFPLPAAAFGFHLGRFYFRGVKTTVASTVMPKIAPIFRMT